MVLSSIFNVRMVHVRKLELRNKKPTLYFVTHNYILVSVGKSLYLYISGCTTAAAETRDIAIPGLTPPFPSASSIDILMYQKVSTLISMKSFCSFSFISTSMHELESS